MHDSLAIPACFSSSEKQTDEPSATVTRSGQSVFMSVYRTKLAGQCRLITVTWCKNLLLHGLSVSVQTTDGEEDYQCKVELKPWNFWRKQGFKQFIVDGRTVDVVWDLKAAKFNGETEPQSDYYVAIVCEEEVVLVLGDQKKDAYRRTRCRPALVEPTLVSRKEHVFGKKKFTTRVNFLEKGKLHQISIECSNSTSSSGTDPLLEIKVDGNVAIRVKHLQWKFRGNGSINVSKTRVEVIWDVHDWFFVSGPRQGLFIFKPVSPSSSSSSSSTSYNLFPSSSPFPPQSSPPSSSMLKWMPQEVNYAASVENENGGGSFSSGFCLVLHAWKVE